MLNKYPLWKNLLLVAIVALGLLYALPNLYGEDPALQVSGKSGVKVNTAVLDQVTTALQTAHITEKSIDLKNSLLIRFNNTEAQLHAKDLLQATLGDQYTVALNLAPATPRWLSIIGAEPMKQGLDLRGGIHLLLDVDVNTVFAQRAQGMLRNVSTDLREADIRYLDIAMQKNNVIALKFRDSDAMGKAYSLLRQHFPDFQLTRNSQAQEILAQLSPAAINNIRQSTLDQTMTTLNNRVNELGIAEAEIQQQGTNRIAVNMPGILDTARAQDILGGTATLEFHMVDYEHDARNAMNGVAPPGTSLYMSEGRPYLLKNQIILSGDSITDANAGFDQNGRPSVNVTLGGSGGGEAMFHRTTTQNIGKLMAIVYVESKVDTKMIKGQAVKTRKKLERVISVATIQSALGSHFQITGLKNAEESRDLALMLRAGALPANIDIVEQQILGPQLGMENIKKGFLSVAIGMAIVIVFLILYYQLFGLIADLALLINLVLLVALLSVLGMTLTLPGIAGIVLTVGLAVDANVLIFERIREELRNGASPQASMHTGYERAFGTIVDANITTLIVALVLFGIGTGSVKGFAVTLTLGLLTSMFCSVGITRAIVNAIYGGRSVKRLSIGL